MSAVCCRASPVLCLRYCPAASAYGGNGGNGTAVGRHGAGGGSYSMTSSYRAHRQTEQGKDILLSSCIPVQVVAQLRCYCICENFAAAQPLQTSCNTDDAQAMRMAREPGEAHFGRLDLLIFCRHLSLCQCCPQSVHTVAPVRPDGRFPGAWVSI